MKEALTYTIIAGNKICTYDCGICISKMTPDYGIGTKPPEVNWRNFEKANEIAKSYNAKTVLITGKGEPTLYPSDITKYLHKLEKHNFGRIELQTNGSEIAKGGLMDHFLDIWYDHGLSTVSVSIYHPSNQRNEEAFKPKSGRYPDLEHLIEKIHSEGLNTRLSCVMLKGYVDTIDEVQNLIQFTKKNGVFQLTLRGADKPKSPLDNIASNFVDKYGLDKSRMEEISDFLEKNGKKCEVMPYGAVVYEVNGQNVCFTSGITDISDTAKKESARNLIFFPQGWLTTNWENVQGGRLL